MDQHYRIDRVFIKSLQRFLAVWLGFVSGCQDPHYLLDDRDLDGWRDCAEGVDSTKENPCDCDDTNALRSPDLIESCNDIDDDCNEMIDDGIPTRAWYSDNDGDGYGTGEARASCGSKPGEVNIEGDCDDADFDVNPGEVEECDGEDEDCSGVADDGILAAEPWFQDKDGDGYGDNGVLIFTCEAEPAGYVRIGNDCDDTRKDISPAAPEICNGLDDDCDGQSDDDLPETVYFRDQDLDGYGTLEIDSPDAIVEACKQPAGFSASPTDCNDSDPAIHPEAVEACTSQADINCDGLIGAESDADHDGYLFCEDGQHPSDCNDHDPAIHPYAQEQCNGEDDDCDTHVDDLGEQIWYRDADSDGYGTMEAGTEANPTIEIFTGCISGWVMISGDCDDGDAIIHPSAIDTCNGLDDDCDGAKDDGLELFVWYRDHDQDGYGINLTVDSPLTNDGDPTRIDCRQPSGYALSHDDCEDTADTIHPYAVEICGNGIDYNCDGNAGTEEDLDEDTFATCRNPDDTTSQLDCDDDDRLIFPGAEEVCDAQDNDCNAVVDDVEAHPLYRDLDQDGYGAAEDGVITLAACQLTGWSLNKEDCDNRDNTRHPGAEELCDGKDNNCDQETPAIELDRDGDSFKGCVYNTGPADCDDTNKAVHPGAPEQCNEQDDDCDLSIDEDASSDPSYIAYYQDSDHDTYGDPFHTRQQCNTPPLGYVEIAGDCDDNNPDTNPQAPEQCDQLDNNCNGQVDETQTTITQYPDDDHDGYGDKTSEASSGCKVEDGYVTNNLDCNDNDRDISPKALEVCDKVDNNCNVAVNEGVTLTFYIDADADGYGDPALTVQACTLEVGLSSNNLDCDDTQDYTHPGAVELCDGADNTCNNQIDEGVQRTYYQDEDQDGFGGPVQVFACTMPAGTRPDSPDCDDHSGSVYPGAFEQCNDIDDDCNGLVDDSSESRLWYLDADGDGYGNNADSVEDCAQPEGRVADSTDCADSDDSRHPFAEEDPDNGLDDDCNGFGDADLYVGHTFTPDNQKFFSKIQDAIVKAKADDTISVSPGVYQENVDFLGKNLTLVGSTQDPSSTIINAASGSVVTFKTQETAGARLAGFLLEGGSGSSSTCTAPSGDTMGGGICIYGASPTIQDVLITAVGGKYGPGIYVNGGVSGGVATFSKVKVYDLSSTSGAVYVSGSATVSFSASEFSRNSALSHGGALYLQSGSVTLDDCLLQSNLSYGNGGAVYAQSSTTLTSNRSRFTGNAATWLSTCSSGDCGAGGALWDAGTARLLDQTEVDHNMASKSGCTSSSASCSNGYGGGVAVTTLTLSDSTVHDNAATGNGGGISCDTCTLKNVELAFNTTSFGRGAGISVNTELTSLSNVSIHHNTAGGDGGGAWINLTKSGTTATDLSLHHNRSVSWSGGGLFCSYSSFSSTCTFDRLSVEDNQAGGWGGGIFSEAGTLSVVHARIAGNRSHRGGGLVVFGARTLLLENVIVSGNVSTTWGGGIHLQDGSRTLTNLTIAGNFAGIGGGGLYLEQGTAPTLQNSILAFNESGDRSLGPNLYSSNVTSPGYRYNLFYSPTSSDGVGVAGLGTDASAYLAGLNNVLGEDPLFVNGPLVRGPGDDDLHLLPGSPALDKGYNVTGFNDPCYHYSDAADQNLAEDFSARCGGSSQNPSPTDPTDRNDIGAYGGPRSAATDNDLDGLPDDWEATYGLNVHVFDATSDYDGDGLTNEEELAETLNPTALDSDGDGLPDDEELDDGDPDTDPTDFFAPGPHLGEPHVGYVGSGLDFETIQAAIHAAGSGAIIRVGPGNWVEQPTLWQGDLTLESTDGPLKTSLDAASYTSVLRVLNADGPVTVRGFTLKNGYGMGGGVVALSPDISLEDITFSSCRTPSTDWEGQNIWYGGAVYAPAMPGMDHALTLSRVTIDGSSARSAGGALYLTAADGTDVNLKLRDSTLSNNKCNDGNHGGSGGAIYLTGTGSGNLSVSISDSILSGNLARSSTGYGGGALYLVPGTTGSAALSFTNATLTSNAGSLGGAVYLKSDASGGVEVSVAESTFKGNQATSAEGGALNIQSSAGPLRLELTDATFDSNQSGNSGGALYLLTSGSAEPSVTIADSRFLTNTATGTNVWGGALLLDGVLAHPIRTSVQRSTFVGNKTNGYDGGAISGNNVFLTVTQTQLQSNVARYGGAISVSSSTLWVEGSVFDGNQGREGGAAIDFDDAQVDIVATRFTGNACLLTNGGGRATLNTDNGTSDGRFNGDERLTLTQVLMSGNTSVNANTALDIISVPTTITHSTFVGNKDTGGTSKYALAIDSTTLTLRSSIIALNSDDGNLYTRYTTVVESNNLFFSQVDGKHRVTGFTPSSTDIVADPLFLDDWRDNVSTDDDFHLQKTSPAINAGLSSLGLDPDESLPDLGIFGGPDGDLIDFDLDGYFDYFWPGTMLDAPAGVDSAEYDCDDWDASVGPCSMP